MPQPAKRSGRSLSPCPACRANRYRRSAYSSPATVRARSWRWAVELGPEVDPKSLQVRRYYLVGQRVWHIALSPDDKRLYTANGNSSDVSVIDLERQEVVKSIGVGRSPWGVVVAP